MKIAIVGAGAAGGYLGARLAHAGERVTLVARGPHLAAMRAHGVRVRSAEGDLVAHPHCTDDLAAVSDAGVVFLTVKAHAVPEIAPRLGALLAPETTVVTAQNGIPWWYFAGHGGALAGGGAAFWREATAAGAGPRGLESVDPGGVIARSLELRRVIGCVVWPATRLVEPGVIEHVEGNRLTLGEPDGARSERCQALSAALRSAGLKSPISLRIRHEIWLKLLGNVAFNPISALTRATMVEIATDPATRAVARSVMEEANRVARALGEELEITVEQRLAGAEKVGAHKPSMLQDLEAGRPLEVEALLGAVVELGDWLEIPLPHLRSLYACARLLNQKTLHR